MTFLKSLLPPVSGSRHVSNSLVQLRTATCDTVLVKKMVSLHCLAKNIKNYTSGVYLSIHKDTSAFFTLIINPSITYHNKVNKKGFQVCVCWWCGFFWVAASLTVSIFHCSLLALYLWVHLFPIVGWTLTCCLIGCVCFWLPSKLLRATPTKTPGKTAQTGLSSTFLSNSSEVESQKKHICVWEQQGDGDSWTFSSLQELVNCCLVMILGI